MANAIKKTYGGQTFNVMTQQARDEEAAAAAAQAEPVQPPTETKTKGRTSRKTQPVEETDALEETTSDA